MSRYRCLIATVIVTMVVLAVATSQLMAPGATYAGLIEPQTGMEFVAIEPGSFVMGSPIREAGRNTDEVAHRVTITKRLFVGRHEVTQTQWAMVMGQNPSHFKDCSRCPVENVDFYEVATFITKLNAQSTSMRYRLPTEAEWEYVCRAGTRTPFTTGERITADQANVDGRFPYAGSAAAASSDKTRPVGSFAPNPWGLYDVHGNVWEWTNDWYGPYDSRADTDPKGPGAGTVRVIRGGSWHFDANSARCALRYTHAPQDKGFSLGFRVVAEPITRGR
jgi:formylglycine-generating enzyme required for sulfatase activity